MIFKNHSQKPSYSQKILFIILGIMLLKAEVFAQKNKIEASKDTLYLDGKVPSDKLSVLPYMMFYYDFSNNLTVSKVSKEIFTHQFDSYLNQFKDKTLWIRLTIKNTSLTDTLVSALYFGEHKVVDVYEKNVLGSLVQTSAWRMKAGESLLKEVFEIPIRIAPKQTITYLIKTTEFIYFSYFSPELFSANTKKELTNEPNTQLFGFLCLIIGVCFFMGIFALVQSIYNKDATYGFWSIYLLVNAFFFFAELDHLYCLSIIPKIKVDAYHRPWTVPIQFLVSMAYVLFLNSFLKINEHNSKIFLYMKWSIAFMFMGFVFALFSVYNYELFLTDYADMLVLATNFLILILIIKIVRAKIPQRKLILIGTFGVLMAASIAACLEVFDLKNMAIFWSIPIVCYAIGSIWELALFSLALSERTKLIQLENQTLQKNYTKQLETELAERVNIIQTQNKLLEEQRIIALTSDFEQKIAETEITALRSQMNPHFIFNCLNSIKLYSLENDSQAASDYLTKFSRLIRLVLENSRSEKVTLENELETLELYIEMEAMRFKDKVKYQINVEQNIDQQFVEIPPLLVQPFVENSIWHGLMHKTEGGLVKIDVSQPTDQMLHIEISDDGIGRAKALEYKSKSAMKSKSLGMKVTKERIELINQIYKINTSVEIIDLKNKKGEAIGTKVILNIPI